MQLASGRAGIRRWQSGSIAQVLNLYAQLPLLPDFQLLESGSLGEMPVQGTWQAFCGEVLGNRKSGTEVLTSFPSGWSTLPQN